MSPFLRSARVATQSTLTVQHLALLVLGLMLAAGPRSAAAQSQSDPCQGGCYLVGDRVWVDSDEDGIQDGAEPGLGQAIVTLYPVDAYGTPLLYMPWRTGTTNALGYYGPWEAPAGDYVLQFAPPPTSAGLGGLLYWRTLANTGINDDIDSDAWGDGFTNVFTLDGHTNHSHRWDAGFVALQCGPEAPWILGDTLFRDMDGDGRLTVADQPLPGVEVALWRLDTPPVGPRTPVDMNRSTTTDAQGRYRFECLAPATYYIVIDSVGDFVVSSVFDSNPNNHVENDNNCATNAVPEHQGNAAAMSAPILLPDPGGGIETTLDCAFTCLEAPVDVVLVLDVSGSMAGSKLDKAKAAAKKFVDEMNDPQRIAIVAFASEPEPDDPDPETHIVRDLTVVSPATRPAIHADIYGLEAGGGTRIDLGLQLGMDVLSARPPSETPSSFLIVLSDGKPDPPGFRAAAVERAAAAKALGYKIISVGLGTDADMELMTELASGPTYVRHSPTEDQLEFIFHDLISRLCDPRGGGLRCSGPDAVHLSFSTGQYTYTDNQGHRRDSKWDVSPMGAPAFDAFLATPPYDTWTTMSDTEWISHAPDAHALGSGGIPGDPYVFEFPFPLTRVPAYVQLVLDVWADDGVSAVRLNGNALSLDGNGNFTIFPPAHLVHDNAYFSTYNTLTVEVRDSGAVVEGLDVQGSLTACDHPDPGLIACGTQPVRIATVDPDITYFCPTCSVRLAVETACTDVVWSITDGQQRVRNLSYFPRRAAEAIIEFIEVTEDQRGPVTIRATDVHNPSNFDERTLHVWSPPDNAPTSPFSVWVCVPPPPPPWPIPVCFEFKTSDPLTPAEKAFIVAHPICAWQAMNINRAMYGVRDKYFPGPPAQCRDDGFMGNAFLHALGNCLLAQRCGVNLAREFTNAHEERDSNTGQTCQFASMDLHNNQVGRDLFHEALASSPCPQYGVNCVRQVLRELTRATPPPSRLRWSNSGLPTEGCIPQWDHTYPDPAGQCVLQAPIPGVKPCPSPVPAPPPWPTLDPNMMQQDG